MEGVNTVLGIVENDLVGYEKGLACVKHVQTEQGETSRQTVSGRTKHYICFDSDAATQGRGTHAFQCGRDSTLSQHPTCEGPWHNH